MWWTWTLGAFLCGAILGWIACFVWVAETIGSSVDRIETQLKKRGIEYSVRHDDAARNDYQSEL